MSIEQLLLASKETLSKPTREARRKLLVVMNIVFILSTTFFLTSEKLAQGKFTPIIGLLIYVYLPAIVINACSLVYNLKVLFKSDSVKRLDNLSAWASMVSIFFLNFCNLMGYGNPSSDALLTDYALGHSLILISVIVIGRKATVAWFLILVSTLVFNVNRLGWDYAFHYQTPLEVKEYKAALQNKEPWALERKQILEQASLNPPKATRYFNIWLIFIIVSLFTSIFFSGITVDIVEKVPQIVDNIEKSIEQSNEVEKAYTRQQNELSQYALRMASVNDTFDRIELELEKLDFTEKDKFRPVIKSIRSTIQDNSDWEHFKYVFDRVHTDFFKNLEEKHSALTEAEMKHLVYIKLGFNNHKIAKMLRVKNSSRRSLKYRIKKKLHLDEEQDLLAYLDTV